MEFFSSNNINLVDLIKDVAMHMGGYMYAFKLTQLDYLNTTAIAIIGSALICARLLYIFQE